KHRASQSTDYVHRVHCVGRLYERIFEITLLSISAPHQALHDAGNPHRRNVEDDADRREPEVPFDKLQRIELAIIEPGDQAVEGAERDEADPAETAGMNVT